MNTRISELSSYDEIVAATCDSGNGFHATHVTNIATGSDPKTKNSGIAPDAEIVAGSVAECHVIVFQSEVYNAYDDTFACVGFGEVRPKIQA